MNEKSFKTTTISQYNCEQSLYTKSMYTLKKKEIKTVFLTQSLKAIYEALSRYH